METILDYTKKLLIIKNIIRSFFIYTLSHYFMALSILNNQYIHYSKKSFCAIILSSKSIITKGDWKYK